VKLLRTLATLAGVGILAAVAHVTIMATGGYGWDTNAPLTIALACGVAIGAPVAGASPRAIAWLVALAVIAGELYGFQATASWHVAHLEAQAAPIHELEAKRAEAKAWVAKLETDDRVERAERALRDARTDANAKSTAKDCSKGCIAMLGKTVDDATAAVAEARQSLQLEQRQARAALTNAPLPPSANALADRLGWPAWELDLIGAGLRSFACTALAFGLLFFAAHGRHRHEPMPTSSPARPQFAPVNVVDLAPKRAQLNIARSKAAPLPVKIGDVDAFMLECVRKDASSRLSWVDAFVRYRTWCEEHKATPVDVSAFGSRLDALRGELGLETRTKGKEVFFVGLKLAS
jgi:hypothetical protein